MEQRESFWVEGEVCAKDQWQQEVGTSKELGEEQFGWSTQSPGSCKMSLERQVALDDAGCG